MFQQLHQPSSRSKLLKLSYRALILTVSPLILSTVVAIAQTPAVPGSTGRQSQDKEPLRIEAVAPVERSLSGGEAHTYEINLTLGQFIYLIVDQRGIDVAVTIYGPDGKEILEVDSPNDDRGPEAIWHVSGASGIHKVVVRSRDKEAFAGKYEMRLEKQRAATTEDQQHADAQKDLLQGAQLLTPKTEESTKKAAVKFNSALELLRLSGDRPGEAKALLEIGQFYSILQDDSEKALEYYDRALALVRELGDKRTEAFILYFSGEEYISTTEERKRKSLTYYHPSLALMREVGDQWGEARVMNTLGLVYLFLTEPHNALKYFTPLLSLELSLDDRGSAAITLNYTGRVYSSLGEYQKALDAYNQALLLNRAVGYSVNDKHMLGSIGTAYFELGDYERALTYFEQVNQLNKNEPDPELHGTTLSDIGRVYAKLGDQHKALEFYNQALPIWRQLKSKRAEGIILNNIGSAYRELGDLQKALDFYNQALTLHRFSGNHRGEASTLINLGRMHHLLSDVQKGLDTYRQALEIGQAVGDQTIEAQALDGMARARRSLGNLTEARTHSERALQIVESLRARISTRALRASYQASVQQFYETQIDILMRLHELHPADGYDALALEASERSRSRSLLESLNEAGVDIRQGVDAELLERERSLQHQLHAKAAVHTRLLSGKHTEEQIAASKSETATLLTLYQEVEAQIRVHSPRYAALTQPVSFSLKDIQQVLDPNTLLLEYHLGDERSFLWAVTKDSLASFTLPKRAEIEPAARRVYDLLTARNQRVRFETANEKQTRIARADADFAGAARFLSQLLLTPVASELKEHRLLIVNDGALHYIPFAALPIPAAHGSPDQVNRRSTAEPQPLIVAHEVVNLPSALSLATLRRELAGRKPAAKTLAVFADPVFDKEDERVRTSRAGNRPYLQTVVSQAQDSTRSMHTDLLRSAGDTAAANEPIQIQRLPFTRREANQIAALTSPSERKEALDFAASRASATSADLSGFRYVHFATHGFLNSRHPELSGIVLSLVDREGKDQDGFLRAYEIFNLKLPAEMVVLSGCRTGLGKEIKGEGMVGLTRGFMYAGAARVLVSLWDISDEAFAELMTQLYREILGKKQLRPAAALRAAQIKIWKEKQWHAPYYWAAFVLQGEPR